MTNSQSEKFVFTRADIKLVLTKHEKLALLFAMNKGENIFLEKTSIAGKL